MATELTPGVYWVGVVDWGLRHFHGYELSTHRGSTYNSYLIVDEKVALVDTVWSPFTDDYLAHLRGVIDPARIDYVITNHGEPDHSGALPAVMRCCPGARVVVSKRGAESVAAHYRQKWDFQVVGTGDRLSLGRRELLFVEAPMLHWPDTMFAYLTGDQILISNDAFGQHYATAFRFNDQVDRGELFEEAHKYYANILTPFSDRVLKKIDEVLALNVPIKMIAPSHGVIWRRDPLQIVDKYREWAAQKPAPYAVVIYETMWEATRRMAEAVAEGLQAEGVEHKLFYASVSDRNDINTEIFKARAVILGSSTHNRGVLAPLAPVLEDIRGMGFRNKIGAAFGSYGWSGEGVKVLEEHLTAAGIPVVAPGVRAKWQPSAADLQDCRELGRKVAAAVKA